MAILLTFTIMCFTCMDREMDPAVLYFILDACVVINLKVERHQVLN